ncbi:MAG TPA: SpoIIE family protein phosphatase [Acidimicrobiales bacterium]|jgi:GAF domain-containing protein|nr:SpoIIE family protein phosphatase [Acidimicrobiales bacterium]
MRTVGELVIGPEPDAVPRARRLVRLALADRSPDESADAELVASELVTNATLHGEPPVTVRVLVDRTIRIEVEDDGRSAPIQLQQNTDAMTGRGLAMVGALSSRWGVDPIPSGGKVVWAEIDGAAADRSPATGPEIDIDALLAAWSDEDRPPTHRVHLGPVSTELLLEAKAHIDNVVRELTLVRHGEGRGDIDVPPAMAELIRAVTVDFAEARDEIKRQAAAAATRGDAMTDLVLDLPTEIADAGERYLAALEQADRYARRADLLTLAPPLVHRIFREWYVQSLVDHLRAVTRGVEPAAPRPLQLVLAERITHLAEQADTSGRLAVLQAVTRDLAMAGTAEQMAHIVVDHAVMFLGVETARVRLPVDGVLRSIAWRHRDPYVESRPHPDVEIDSELPGAEVFRTRKRAYIRDISQALIGYPDMASRFPTDRSGHMVPLTVGHQALGVLSLSFTAGELSDETEIAVVESIADVLAQALKRAELTASDDEKRETLSLLAEATEIMITARQPDAVLERLVSLAVPRLGDWCTVYLVDGEVLRRAAMFIDGFPEATEVLTAEPLPINVPVPQTQAFRTGRVVPMTANVGHLLERLYPGLDFGALGGDADQATGVCVPITLRGRRIGVIGLTFLRSRRKVTPQVMETLIGLAARAAIALDNAQRWTAQREAMGILVAALLPTEPPRLPTVEFVARYLPAAGDVAGDWWEAEEMHDGTVLIGLGDAAGHGLGAVSQMSELRHGARALAAVEPSPSALLVDLNRRLIDPDSGFATAFYGRLDPNTGALVWASAGHVPPLVLRADGSVEALDRGGSTPLGTPSTDSVRDQHLRLHPGDTLLLYTDGVVERRDRGIDVGIRRLGETLSNSRDRSLSGLADQIIREYCAERSDDCCLLMVRYQPPENQSI